MAKRPLERPIKIKTRGRKGKAIRGKKAIKVKGVRERMLRARERPKIS